MKFWNKWLRKIHRWLALPFIVVILLFVFGREMPWGAIVQRFQQLMLLIFVVTGGYLFLLPYLAKWQRQRKQEADK